MRIFACVLLLSLLSSCWKWKIDPPNPVPPGPIGIKNVWGNKPIYGIDTTAKKLIYNQVPYQQVPAFWAGALFVRLTIDSYYRLLPHIRKPQYLRKHNYARRQPVRSYYTIQHRLIS